jgi:hypothetical protein
MKKYIFLIFLLSTFTVGAASFEFKDGTIVKGAIYYDSKNIVSVSNPTPKGIFIKTLDNKIYVHHYPLMNKAYRDNRDGTYTPVTSMGPPLDDGNYDNPSFMPNCAPARINFFYFSKKTQKELYVNFFNLTRHYATSSDKGFANTTALLDAKQTALSIHAHIKGTAYIPKNPNTLAKRKKWQDKVGGELAFSEHVSWHKE